MASKDYNLRAIFSAVDKISAPLKGIKKSIKDVKSAIGNLKSAGGDVASAFAPVAKAGAVLSGGMLAGGAFVLKTASQFERYQTILETIEGSSEKAKASMKWVSEFAAKTPYELDQTTDAFVRLKAYGIDPQGGALRAAGDAAAAMGKPLEQAVEALADAMTGENERLKEFGIKASKEGDKIVYRWTENGKTMAAVAKASSGKQIEETLKGIWSRRYSGAMDKLSNTWEGMWSNLQDTIAQFALEIGNAGVFDALKTELRGVLDTFNRMSADGSLKKYAQDISKTMIGLYQALKGADWEKIGKVMKVVFAVAIVAQIASISAALVGFGTAVVALNPVVLMFVLLAAAAAALYVNWKDVVGGAKALWQDLSAVVGLAVDKMLEKIQPLLDMGSRIKGALGSFFGGGFGGVSVLGARGANGVNGAPAGAGGGNTAGALKAQQAQVAGEMTVRFENAPAGLRAESGKTSAPGFSLNPSVGYRSAAWGNA